MTMIKKQTSLKIVIILILLIIPTFLAISETDENKAKLLLLNIHTNDDVTSIKIKGSSDSNWGINRLGTNLTEGKWIQIEAFVSSSTFDVEFDQTPTTGAQYLNGLDTDKIIMVNFKGETTYEVFGDL